MNLPKHLALSQAPTILRSAYFGVPSLLASSLLAFALASAAWTQWRPLQRYPDPVVGALAWTDLQKEGDFLAVGTFVAACVLFAFLIGLLCRAASNGRDPESSQGTALSHLLLYSLVPAAWSLANAMVIPSADLPPLRWLILPPALVILAAALLCKFRGSCSADDITITGAAFALAPFFAAFSGLATLIPVARLIAPGQLPSLANVLPKVVGASSGLALLVGCGLLLLSPSIGIARGRVLRLLVATQVLLPLLVIHLVPPPMLDAAGRVISTFPRGLFIVLSLAALAGMAAIAWRLFAPSATPPLDRPLQPLVRSVSSLSVAAIVVLLYCDHGALPEIFRDYFHFGEQVVPWQQLYDFHAVPFVDFAPIHGAMELIWGCLNQVFFDGTLGSHQYCVVLLKGIVIIALALATSAVLTPVGALILLFVSTPYLDRLYLAAPAVLLVSAPRILVRPVAWLWSWLAVLTVLTLYSPSVGPTFAVASFPVFLYMVCQAYRAARRPLLRGAAVVGSLALLLLLIPLTRHIAIGFIHFLSENAWTNDVANALTYAQGLNQRNTLSGHGSTQLQWELVRFMGIPLAVVAVFVAWRELSRDKAERRLPVAFLALASGLILLLNLPWAMGRIDPANPSRVYAVSQLGFCFLIPPIVLLAASRKQRAAATVLVAGALGYLHPSAASTLHPDALRVKVTVPIHIPAGVEFVDGKDFGMPRLGQVIRPAFFPELLKTQKVFAELVPPGGAILDLTNEAALYHYLGYRFPVLYPAYVAANSRLQSRMLEQLRRNPVSVVLAHPCAQFDGGPASLRCYLLYREYALRFLPVARDQFIFLVDPAKYPDVSPTTQEARLTLLDQAFRPGQLVRIPIAWGRSWGTLRSRFDRVALIGQPSPTPLLNATVSPGGNIQPAPSSPSIQVQLSVPPDVTDGTVADFLRIELDFKGKGADCGLELRWTDSSGQQSAPIVFDGTRGQHLIPLGAFPRWLLCKSPRSLELQITRGKGVLPCRVVSCEFLRLKRP